jgi:hypothetical protein
MSTTSPIPLDDIVLTAGNHAKRGKQLCIMEAVAWFANLPHSDQPSCTCAPLTTFGIGINDSMPDEPRQKLKPLIPLLVGTKDDAMLVRRAYYFADRAVRVLAPEALRRIGLNDEATKLEALAPITSPETAYAASSAANAARSAANAARSAANAARSAANAASSAAYAASYAANAASSAANAARSAANAAQLRSGRSQLRSERSPLRSERSPLRSERSQLRSVRSQLRSERSPLRSERSQLRSERSPLRSVRGMGQGHCSVQGCNRVGSRVDAED